RRRPECGHGAGLGRRRAAAGRSRQTRSGERRLGQHDAEGYRPRHGDDLWSGTHDADMVGLRGPRPRWGNGNVILEKLTLVVDAGTIVHPDGALAQVEGAALWGVSLAWHEGSEFV